MALISENGEDRKISSPETVAESWKGTWFGLGSLAVAWGAKLLLTGASWLPAIVAGFILFLPPIFAIVGLIHTVQAWRNHPKIQGLVLPAVIGALVAIASFASMFYLLTADDGEEGRDKIHIIGSRPETRGLYQDL